MKRAMALHCSDVAAMGGAWLHRITFNAPGKSIQQEST